VLPSGRELLGSLPDAKETLAHHEWVTDLHQDQLSQVTMVGLAHA
jgi:hypothetical protein